MDDQDPNLPTPPDQAAPGPQAPNALQQAISQGMSQNQSALQDMAQQHLKLASDPERSQAYLNAEKSQRRKDMLTGILGNFIFSLGQGLSASASAPRGQESAAGAGAALQGPQILAQMRQAQQMKQAQIDDTMAQIQQRNVASQRTPLIDPESKQPVLDPNGQPIMSTPADISRNLRDYYDRKSRESVAKEKEDAITKWRTGAAADINQRFYWKNGYQVGFDENGKITPPTRLPDAQLPAGLQEQETKDELAANRSGQTIDRSTFPPKTVALAKEDPRYPAVLKLREQEDTARETYRGLMMQVYNKRMDQNDQRIQIASANLGDKVYGPALDSDTRLRAMTDAAGPDYQGKGSTADQQLLFNHIGMVLSGTHNVRFTQQMINHAISSGGEGETNEARTLVSLYNQLVSGKGFLTPPQRKQMVENARMQRSSLYDKAGRTAALDGLKYSPPMDKTLPPLENQSIPAMPTAPTAPGSIGRNAPPGAGAAPTQGSRTYVGMLAGKPHTFAIPAGQEGAFMKAHPEARPQ